MRTLERMYDSIKRLEEIPNKSLQPLSMDPINSKVKEFAKSQGIDLVGFTTLEPAWVYSYSDNWDNWDYPIKYQPMQHNHVISLGMEMRPEIMNMNHFPDAETLFEALQTYARLGEAVEKITEFIRGLGYQARGHHPYGGDFLYD
jgi:hypothetical protein